MKRQDMPTPSNEELPDTVVLDGSELLIHLSMIPLGFKLQRKDAESIIESLISKLVSTNDPDLLDFNVDVADFNRMCDESIRNDPSKHQKLIQAIRIIEHKLYLMASQLGLFEKNQTFSYMFDSFLGDDIVIFKLPH